MGEWNNRQNKGYFQLSREKTKYHRVIILLRDVGSLIALNRHSVIKGKINTHAHSADVLVHAATSRRRNSVNLCNIIQDAANISTILR